MMSLKHCCETCCWCCYTSDNTTKKYRHVKYSPASSTAESSEMRKIPLERIFVFPQQRTEFSVHPQVSGDSEIITEQPAAEKDYKKKHASHQRAKLEKSETWTCSTDPISQIGPDPVLEFSLFYDIQRRTLTVHLYQAYNLPAKDRCGTSDPFVVMFLLPNKEEIFQSHVVKKTLNPIFDETFGFRGILAHEVYEKVLMFRVFDYDILSKNDFIGTVVLPLRTADLYGATVRKRIDEHMEQPKTISGGHLLLSLSFSPHPRQLLQGTILKATHLQKPHVWRFADPYVKVLLLHKEERVSKWKSHRQKNTLTPVFNEQFQFDISQMDISDLSLEVIVMDYDRLGQNHMIGTTSIGSNVEEEAGKVHWSQILEAPGQHISYWHPMIPPEYLIKKHRRMTL